MKLRLILFVSCLIAVLSHAFAQVGNFMPSDRFSSSLISGLCQDKQGLVWIATDYGLNSFDGYAFKTFLHQEDDTMSLKSNAVTSLLCDNEGRLWVGTNHGLDQFDYASESFIHYSLPDTPQARITSLLQRHDGTILVGTAGYGAYSLGTDGKLHTFTTAEEGAFCSLLFEDTQGRLWMTGFDDEIRLHTANGLQRFQSERGNPQGIVERNGEVLFLCQHGIMSFYNNRLAVANINMGAAAGKDLIFTAIAMNADGDICIGTRGQGIYRLAAKNPLKLERTVVDAFDIDPNTAKVEAAMFDRDGNIWLGCERKGLLMIPLRPVQFHSWNFAAQGIRLGSTISSVCEGDGGMVWCTVQGVGVYGFDRDGHIAAHPQAPLAVEFIFRDRQRRYWLGTDDGLYSYDPLTGHSELKVIFDCDKFNDMTSDDEGLIYISTFSRGFCVYNPQTGSLRNHNFSEDTDSLRGRLCNNWVMGMSADSKGLLWLATSSGVACYDPHNDSFRSQGWESLLDGVMCFDVCELHSGRLSDGRLLDGCIAIGTEQGLYLYDYRTRKAERFPGSSQLTNKVVSYIVQGNNGDLWCSTSEGIWRYSPTEDIFTSHLIGNGLTHKEYIYGVGMHSDNDLIYFGQNDGLTVFSPGDVKDTPLTSYPLQLSSFRVGDQYVNARTILNGVEVTDGVAVSECNKFTLSYLDHTVTLAFSQFNFDNPHNIVLEYRVNNGSWVRNPAGKNDFTLGHLQPGNYRIEARVLQGTDYSPVKMVEVYIRSPWYSSTIAYIIYALILASLLFYVLRTYRRRASEQLNEEKMKFLINATHDIRSPLTIILSALKKMKNGDNEIAKKGAVETIEHNSKRILNLVNQILDVRKIDKQQLKLRFQPTDMVSYISGICKMYDFTAKERDIKFTFEHEGLDNLTVFIDRSQFDKVISNLLSNAFKYSSNGGEVTISLTADETNARVQVADHGEGLDADSMKHIFDRFYQGNNSRKLHVEGTGIGLNLCKMIVDMHHGTIEAANRTGNQGALFTVSLPLGSSHLKPEDIEETTANADENEQATAAKSHGKGYRVLIVDDDTDLSSYITQELGRYYKFGICHNGKEGMKELLTGESYDVVVSDVMMPEMDGFTMLRLIKTNMNLSHLPVIMLTSMADVGNRLEGLERGADAFLAKPFDMDELHLTIDNLIQTRRVLKGKYTGAQQQFDKVEHIEVKGNDEQLMERIMKAINKNLSDSDFNVEMLTQEVGISRAQLHRKMKEMTGISTSDFIRNIRLEQAARLLKEQKINVTQVAYSVGFSNLAHFSALFQKHFGVAPSKYAESL